MKILRTYKASTNALMALLYLFVVLFSQVFHSHKVNLDTDFHSKTKKSFSKSVKISDESGCIWCHQILENAVENPQQFFSFSEKNALFGRQIFAYQQKFGTLYFNHFYLRGPPKNFV